MMVDCGCHALFNDRKRNPELEAIQMLLFDDEASKNNFTMATYLIKC